MVPATTSYTVLLCWKKRRVMKTGKRNAMEKFLLSARTVDLRKRRNTVMDRFPPGKTAETRPRPGLYSAITHAERDTLDAGTTRTRLGRTSVDVSHVTTRRPSRNFPGVAPPAPQMQSV